MKLKELTDIMYATAGVYLYDSDNGFYCYPVYKGEVYNIPELYMNRTVHSVDSGLAITITLECEEVLNNEIS